MDTEYIYKELVQSFSDRSLLDSIINQYGDLESLVEQVEADGYIDASTGVSGFIYYSDTVKFTKQNLKSILSLLQEEAYQIGYESIIDHIASFGCLKGISKSEIELALLTETDDTTQVYNALAWYCIEYVGNLIESIIRG